MPLIFSTSCEKFFINSITMCTLIRAKYEQLSREHEKMKEVYAQCEASRDTCMQEQKKLSQKVSNLVAGNRELKGQLLEAERYKDLVEKAMARIKALEQSIETMEKDIVDTRYILHLLEANHS